MRVMSADRQSSPRDPRSPPGSGFGGTVEFFWKKFFPGSEVSEVWQADQEYLSLSSFSALVVARRGLVAATPFPTSGQGARPRPTGRRPRPGRGSRGPGHHPWGQRPHRKGEEWAPSPQARLPCAWRWRAAPGLLAWFFWLLALDFSDLLALPVDTGTSEQLWPLAALCSEE